MIVTDCSYWFAIFEVTGTSSSKLLVEDPVLVIRVMNFYSFITFNKCNKTINI